MPVALFGITSSGLNLFVNLVILFLVVVWIALIAWTYLDARRRIADSVLVACATGASVFPFVGTIVYTILRPPEFLEDAREREIEMRASQLRVRQLEEQSCPNCGYPLERKFLRCPNCRNRVKDPCYSCGQPIDPRWTVCPYCEAAVRPSAPAAPRQDASAERRPQRPRATRPAEMPAREPGRAPRSSTAAGRAGAAERPAAREPRKATERPAARQPSDGEERPAASASERPASKARTQRPARRTASPSTGQSGSSSGSGRPAEPREPREPRRTSRDEPAE
jgi:hypothetical protein